MKIEVLYFDHPENQSILIDDHIPLSAPHPLNKGTCLTMSASGDFWPSLGIYFILEPLPIKHVLSHAYPTLIYDPACFIHVHTSIRDCLGWFGS